MLRLSKLTDYATVVMAQIAREPERIHAAAELAAAIGVAAPTVSKVLKMLTGGHLLQSVRGPKGGYMLSRPAAQISVAEVIDAMEGPIGVTECSAIAGLCAQEGSCSVRGNWQGINRVIHNALDAVTLADLAHPGFKPTIRPVHLDRRLARPQRASASGSQT
jgi:FeS assembly SUF system regulator